MSISFETDPSRYRHWRLSFEGAIATLAMNVDPRGGLHPGYELKLNSYDLGVDIELADAVQRIRFEHPEVRCVVITSANDRVFSAGANIYMLRGSSHAFKVNFCKFTNETRLYIEDASRHSGIKFLCAINGSCAGGGYELALACDDITLVDDAASAVSLPEVPLLGVLPGTGGLTRLVDKRKVRRDLADLFCTVSEGVRGKRAFEWGLVDAYAPRSRFETAVGERVRVTMEKNQPAPNKGEQGWKLDPLAPEVEGARIRYRHVELSLDAASRVAELTIAAPEDAPAESSSVLAQGADLWALRAFRELDDALLRLRFNHPEVGVIVLRTRGSSDHVLAWDRALEAHRDHWLVNEVLRFQARVLRRLDLTARSLFALVDRSSAFGGVLFEIALAADRIYMLEDEEEKVAIALSSANAGSMPMSNGLSRLQTRFLATPEQAKAALSIDGPIATVQARTLGLVTITPDELDWDQDVRVAIQERASLSPDALTGMEASLRFAGPETMETKIFARLSAWQNWIFQRPNAVGPEGALTTYGKPERPAYDWTRC